MIRALPSLRPYTISHFAFRNYDILFQPTISITITFYAIIRVYVFLLPFDHMIFFSNLTLTQ